MRVSAALVATAALLAAPSSGISASADTACDAATARSLLDQHIRAFNRGEYVDLQALFALEPAFGWYAVSPPYGRTLLRSQNRATLMKYFRARHAKRETLRVVRFNFASTQERGGVLLAHFNGHLTRGAADLPRERRGFKASIQCATSTQFVIVSIGTKI